LTNSFSLFQSKVLQLFDTCHGDRKSPVDLWYWDVPSDQQRGFVTFAPSKVRHKYYKVKIEVKITKFYFSNNVMNKLTRVCPHLALHQINIQAIRIIDL